MTHSLELIIQTESFQHAKLTITGENRAEILSQLDTYTDENLQFIGQWWIAAKSQILAGKNGALAPSTDTRPPEQLIQEELGGKVLDVTEHQVQPVWLAPVETQPKVWDKPEVAPVKPKPTDEGFDF